MHELHGYTIMALLALAGGLGLLALAPAAGHAADAVTLSQRPDDLPEGFEQVIPRGRIAAIVDPEFVSADEADIAPDSWVLGVVIDGEARAYSLKLLNAHEVVNDSVGGTRFAAVW